MLGWHRRRRSSSASASSSAPPAKDPASIAHAARKGADVNAAWSLALEGEQPDALARAARQLARSGELPARADAAATEPAAARVQAGAVHARRRQPRRWAGGMYSRLEPLGLQQVLRPLRDKCRRRGTIRSQQNAFYGASATHRAWSTRSSAPAGPTRSVVISPHPRLLEGLWAIHDGSDPAWRHEHWNRPKLDLTDDQLAVLPYLEADLATQEISARMIAAVEISKGPVEAQDWVNGKRWQIRDKANMILAAAGQPMFQGSGLLELPRTVGGRPRQCFDPTRVPRAAALMRASPKGQRLRSARIASSDIRAMLSSSVFRARASACIAARCLISNCARVGSIHETSACAMPLLSARSALVALAARS